MASRVLHSEPEYLALPVRCAGYLRSSHFAVISPSPVPRFISTKVSRPVARKRAGRVQKRVQQYLLSQSVATLGCLGDDQTAGVRPLPSGRTFGTETDLIDGNFNRQRFRRISGRYLGACHQYYRSHDDRAADQYVLVDPLMQNQPT
jgi:hypothetical protein